MPNLSIILGIIGNVISILMFASPIQTFTEVVKKKSTENYKGLPYMTTLLSTSLWTYYGLVKTGGLLVVTVNSIGASLHVIYVSLFLIYAPTNTKVRSLKTVAILNVGFFGIVLFVGQLVLKRTLRTTVVGILCAGLTIAMYAAPLSAMTLVIKTKSVKYMPFFLSFTQFLNSGIWSAYALLVKDFYIGVPNGIGFLLGSSQLILHMIYRNKSISEDKTDEDEEQGSEKWTKDSYIQVKHQTLSKVNSLPKPSVARQYSQNITKAISLSPYELGLLSVKDIESGFKGSP